MSIEVCMKYSEFSLFFHYLIYCYYIKRSQQILLSHQPAMQNAAAYSLSIWRKRILRWNQLRVRQSLLALMEPLFDCFFMGIYSSIICMHLYFEWSSKNTCLFFAFHVLLCFLLDYTLIQIIEVGKKRRGGEPQ